MRAIAVPNSVETTVIKSVASKPKIWKTSVVIDTSTTSDAFSLPGIVDFALIGPAGSAGLLLTLRRRNIADTGWVNTALTHTTVTTEDATSEWITDKLIKRSPLLRIPGMHSLLLSSVSSITVDFYSYEG